MPNGSVPNVVRGAVSREPVGRLSSESLDVVVRHLIAQHLGIDANRGNTGDGAPCAVDGQRDARRRRVPYLGDAVVQ